MFNPKSEFIQLAKKEKQKNKLSFRMYTVRINQSILEDL